MENKVLKCDKKRSQIYSSEIRSAIEELSLVAKEALEASNVQVKVENRQDEHAHNISDNPRQVIHAKTFLSLCKILILQVLDKIGPTMAVLRQDVYQNIQRLEMVHESDPLIHSNLVEMIKKEVGEGIARKGSSCSKALVWLTRSLDFTVALLKELVKDPQQNMQQAVEEAYDITLKPCHRWISSAAYRVALKLVPDNQTFISALLAKDENYGTLKEEMQTLILLLGPFLEEIHSVLRFYGLDRIKST